MRDIGKNIRDIRVSQNMTQETLAEALFVTRQTVSNYENGRSRPDIDTVLKIAEVLDTDVNCVIYGLPVTLDRKRAYKSLWTILILLIVTVIGYFVIDHIVETGDIYSLNSLDVLNRTMVVPASFFLLGWLLLHLLGLFCNLKLLNIKRIRAGRCMLWAVVGIIAALLIPHDIFEIMVMLRSVGAKSLNMSFPYIPVYSELSYRFVLATLRFPFLYSILGGLFWLMGIPKTGRQN